MTKEELKQEVEEYISYRPTEGTKDFVVYKVKVGENVFAYVVEHKNELCSSDWIKMYEGTEQECYMVVGYLDSAEPREKRIAELEVQIEKMKCCYNCQKDCGSIDRRICEENNRKDWELRR